MISLLPSLTPDPPNAASVYALIALITDPKAAKARLDELSAAVAAANEAEAKSTAAMADAAAKLATTQKLSDGHAEALAAIDAKRVASVNALTEATQKYEAANAKLAEIKTLQKAFDSNATAIKAALDEREGAIAQREAAVANAEAAAAKAKQDADALVAQYASKLDALKQITG